MMNNNYANKALPSHDAPELVPPDMYTNNLEAVNHHMNANQTTYKPYDVVSPSHYDGGVHRQEYPPMSATPAMSQYGGSTSYAPPNHYPEKPQERKRICGLATSTFILLIILVLVVIGAAVGGGVGGSLAVQRASEQATAAAAAGAGNASSSGGSNTNSAIANATPTTTSGTSRATTTATGGSSATKAGATTVTAASSGSFLAVPTDNVQLPVDCPKLDKSKMDMTLGSQTWSFTLNCGVDYKGSNVDLLAITAYTLQDCLRACASYNHNLGRDECVAVEFSGNMAGEVPKNFGNCWAKNSTGTTGTASATRNIGATLNK